MPIPEVNRIVNAFAQGVKETNPDATVKVSFINTFFDPAAAKQAATQKAMKSASDNADKLITDYTRLRNNARQAEITQQIAEIVGGADALAH